MEKEWDATKHNCRKRLLKIGNIDKQFTAVLRTSVTGDVLPLAICRACFSGDWKRARPSKTVSC